MDSGYPETAQGLGILVMGSPLVGIPAYKE
jgi:hypothetical protein